MFPLAILPLPGELVPLHIFEPRYRQLLQDCEERDVVFGIYFTHKANVDRVGSLMKLESVIKRHPGGESDIIVRCVDLLSMDMLYRTYPDKLYPGGDVRLWNVDVAQSVSTALHDQYVAYLGQLGINKKPARVTVFDIANELSLDFSDRLKFVLMDTDKREAFLQHHIRYQSFLLERAEQAKDVFHLN
jgi:hypothetical protein